MPDFTSFKIMGQCKKILNKVTELPTIISEVKNLVLTNNTVNESGILSQKLSWLINANKNHGTKNKTNVGTENWTCPVGVYVVYAIIVSGSGGGGAGGGGGQAGNTNQGTGSGGSGGGSGSTGIIWQGYIFVTPGVTYTLTVGSGGSGGIAGAGGTTYGDTNSSGKKGGNGGNGGDSKFGNIITIAGGKGGTGGNGGASYNYCKNDTPTDLAGANGGAAVNLSTVAYDVCRTLNVSNSLKGNEGNAGTLCKSSDTSFIGKRVAGGAGGAKANIVFDNKSYIGLTCSSGAGGAGGQSGVLNDSGTNLNGLAGSAGSAGSAGRIFLKW